MPLTLEEAIARVPFLAGARKLETMPLTGGMMWPMSETHEAM